MKKLLLIVLIFLIASPCSRKKGMILIIKTFRERD